MGILRLLTAGALGFVAYKAWQRYQTEPRTPSLRDTGSTTPPHGDPLLVDAELETEPASSMGAQSSRSFGEP